MMISVAMAVYNGEKYIKEQLESILSQLNPSDELIISYNKSTDKTFEIIKEYERNYQQISVYECQITGVIPNFNNALSRVKGDIIVLADQDDIWEENKIATIKDFFCNNSYLLLTHNCSYIDKNGNALKGDLFSYRNAKTGIIKNLIRNSYQGCCMAFRKELLKNVIPVPNTVSMHDQWIGICAEKMKSSYFLDAKLIKYRRREDNTSAVRVPYTKKIVKIFVLIWYLLKV